MRGGKTVELKKHNHLKGTCLETSVKTCDRCALGW